ncbi:MAG: YdeI/OmpD-associated family protein [Bacteroidia bacterium]
MKTKETFCPRNTEEWRNWLENNYDKKKAIWLIYYKQHSPKHNITWSQAVDQALCFGWIDSVINKIDDDKYKQYFSKRKDKSIWSRINKDKVKMLIENGQMHHAGLASIAVAKQNGSWTFLDQVDALIIPEDLKQAFELHNGALAFYEGLSNSIKKQLLYWVVSAKRKETRNSRISEIAENASKGLKPKQFR